LIKSAVMAVEISNAIVIPANHLIALCAVVDGAGEKRAEDRAPGVEEIHIAADRAEGFAFEGSPTDAQKTGSEASSTV
jgi:hypothetical protein